MIKHTVQTHCPNCGTCVIKLTDYNTMAIYDCEHCNPLDELRVSGYSIDDVMIMPNGPLSDWMFDEKPVSQQDKVDERMKYHKWKDVPLDSWCFTDKRFYGSNGAIVIKPYSQSHPGAFVIRLKDEGSIGVGFVTRLGDDVGPFYPLEHVDIKPNHITAYLCGNTHGVPNTEVEL